MTNLSSAGGALTGISAARQVFGWVRCGCFTMLPICAGCITGPATSRQSWGMGTNAGSEEG
ncbi:hypothetical protein TFLX_01353 [Thermoflexales bacterium]|nr:hypothetical protein TFLX_01353 [Thermoflexales bacterium]